MLRLSGLPVEHEGFRILPHHSVSALEVRSGPSAVDFRRGRRDTGHVMPVQPGMMELGSAECLELLERQEVGRLAVSISSLPDIFPINFVVDRGCVVFRTAAGTKLAASVLGRGVAFEVDGVDDTTGEAWSVIVKGHAVELQRMHERFAAAGLPLFPWHASPKHRYLKIEPVQITGRRFTIVGRDWWSDQTRDRS